MEKNLLNITSQIPTPFLVVEKNIVKKNIARIHDYASRHGFTVRPHIKTHKSLYMARMQLDAGAKGIACAKAGEAQIMAKLGDVDITIAYPAVGNVRAKSLAKLCLKHSLRVAVDSQYVMDQLAFAAADYNTVTGILVMFDAGLHRCGFAAPERIIQLAQYAKNVDTLRYDGIQMYLGHLYGDSARDVQSFEQINQMWVPVYDALCSAGLKPEIVSSGSTPSLENTHLIPHINEIRVGTAIYNDYFIQKFDHCTLEECAARVVATVVSDTTAGRVIIDAGSKALSAKQLLRFENLEMGYVVEYPDAVITRLHEEHGWIDVSSCSSPPKVGQRLSIIPVNVSLCVNLYDHFYLITSSGTLHKERIDARGCLV
ncbi:MAG: alanine racemase [Desulfobacula sp.]|uniref:alanine racemase n=1 Tax=Desulfobacula sp. TaxID=2593537 RepID=UPI0025BA62F5|nr:alanine racemase [Desulfobacula sp.]MCD4721957.1 alanine racemase [Desulfobacula sp.]